MADEVQLPDIYADVPLLQTLAIQGIECDQMLSEAIRRASRNQDWDDAELLYELAVLGSKSIVGLDIANEVNQRSTSGFSLEYAAELVFDSRRRKTRLAPPFYNIGSSFIERLVPRHSGTWTTGRFLRDIAFDVIDIESEPNPELQKNWPLTSHYLLRDLTSYNDNTVYPNFYDTLRELPKLAGRSEDNEFVISLDKSGQIRFRPLGHLGDHALRSQTGLLLPTRALQVFGETYGAYSQDQIAELEDLINDSRSNENHFQLFFERHPHFFRRWDYRAIHPHVYLTRESDNDGPLIPDFLLTNQDAQQAFLLDLKLPSERLITRQKNRDRFSAAIMEARAQLTTYRDWFDDKYNREKVKDKLGMSVFRPQLAVIIGRSSEFRDELDRQRLRSAHPDIEVVTYDDILKFCKRRQLEVRNP